MEYLSKFTSAYLKNYFKNKDIPNERWEMVVNGVRHVLDSDYIIDLILKSNPEEQKVFAESLRELDEHDCDIRDFLKHLARMSIVNTSKPSSTNTDSSQLFGTTD